MVQWFERFFVLLRGDGIGFWGAPSCPYGFPGALPEKWQWKFDRTFVQSVNLTVRSNGYCEAVVGWIKQEKN